MSELILATNSRIRWWLRFSLRGSLKKLGSSLWKWCFEDQHKLVSIRSNKRLMSSTEWVGLGWPQTNWISIEHGLESVHPFLFQLTYSHSLVSNDLSSLLSRTIWVESLMWWLWVSKLDTEYHGLMSTLEHGTLLSYGNVSKSGLQNMMWLMLACSILLEEGHECLLSEWKGFETWILK